MFFFLVPKEVSDYIECDEANDRVEGTYDRLKHVESLICHGQFVHSLACGSLNEPEHNAQRCVDHEECNWNDPNGDEDVLFAAFRVLRWETAPLRELLDVFSKEVDFVAQLQLQVEQEDHFKGEGDSHGPITEVILYPSIQCHGKGDKEADDSELD